MGGCCCHTHTHIYRMEHWHKNLCQCVCVCVFVCELWAAHPTVRGWDHQTHYVQLADPFYAAGLAGSSHIYVHTFLFFFFTEPDSNSWCLRVCVREARLAHIHREAEGDAEKKERKVFWQTREEKKRKKICMGVRCLGAAKLICGATPECLVCAWAHVCERVWVCLCKCVARESNSLVGPTWIVSTQHSSIFLRNLPNLTCTSTSKTTWYHNTCAAEHARTCAYTQLKGMRKGTCVDTVGTHTLAQTTAKSIKQLKAIRPVE